MGDALEVLFLSDNTGTILCVNPHVGTTILTYKGATSIKHNALSVVAKDYLLAAEIERPLLHIWPLNSQQPLSGPKIVLAGKVSALTVSPDGYHCVAGIDSKIYIWQTSSGSLLGVLTKHYGSVTKLVFADDSVHFVSCAENGAVFVWRLSTALNSVGENAGPVYSFSHHNLKVTDAFVSPGGMKGRLYTASLDYTCKVYDLRDGSLLLTITFDFAITAIRLNSIETQLYAGTSEGKIMEFNLDPLPRSLNYNVEEPLVSFDGHTATVTAIDISIDGYTLVTASEEGKVFLWDIPSKVFLRAFEMKGPVTNAFLYQPCDNIFTNEFKPNIHFSNLHRVSEEVDINIYTAEDLKIIDFNQETEKRYEVIGNNGKNDEIEELQKKIAHLTKTNKELYQFAMEKILDKPL